MLVSGWWDFRLSLFSNFYCIFKYFLLSEKNIFKNPCLLVLDKSLNFKATLCITKKNEQKSPFCSLNICLSLCYFTSLFCTQHVRLDIKFKCNQRAWAYDGWGGRDNGWQTRLSLTAKWVPHLTLLLNNSW